MDSIGNLVITGTSDRFHLLFVVFRHLTDRLENVIKTYESDSTKEIATLFHPIVE